MADPNLSTLDKLMAVADRLSIFVPVAGQTIKIADVSIHALAAFLDSKEAAADVTELDKAHAEYLRREAIAADPNT